jgi:hypothetical protein
MIDLLAFSSLLRYHQRIKSSAPDMKKTIATLFFILAFASLATAQQTQRYIFVSGSLQPLDPNRPSPNCDRWEIWFYTSGAALKPPYTLPGQPGYRGAIWGRLPPDIQNQAERIQKFQRAYERVVGLTRHDDSWDHSLGPICVAPTRFHPSPAVSRGLRQADNNQIVFSQIWNHLGNAFTNAEPLSPDRTPQFRGTMVKISKAFETNSKLHILLTRTDPPPANEINTAIYEATDAVQKAFVSASDIHAILADSGKTPVWLDSNFIVTDPAFTDTYRFAEIPRGVSIQITHQNHSNSPNQQTKTTIAVLFGNIAKVDAPKFDSEKLRWGVRVTGRSAFTRSPVATPTNRSKTGAVPEVEVNFRFDDKTDAEACYRYLVHHRQ